MSGWLWCCSSLKNENCHEQDEAEVRAALISKRSSLPEGAIDFSNNMSDLSTDTLDSRPVLPDLTDPKVSLMAIGLQRSATDEPLSQSTMADVEFGRRATTLPKRYVSSEMTGLTRSARMARLSSMNVEDVFDHHLAAATANLNTSPNKQRRSNLRPRPSQMNFVENGERGADSDMSESQNVVYSSWFALLSKSIGSDVGSPAWILNSTQQIEGA